MARAYAYCVGSAPAPSELIAYIAIREFGALAVTGRGVLSAREVRDFLTAKSAENIIHYYRSRNASGNRMLWDKNHPLESAELTRAQLEYTKWQTKSK